MIWRSRKKRLMLLSEASAIMMLFCVGEGAVWFALPSIADTLLDNLALVGFFMALPALVGLIVDMPMGDLCDKIDKRGLLLFGLLMMALLGLLLPSVNSTGKLISFLVLIGVFAPAAYIATTDYVMEASTNKSRSSFLGTYTSSINLGLSVGALFAGFLAANVLLANIDKIGILLTVTCIAAALTALAIKKEPAGSITRGICAVVREDKVFLKELSDYKRLGLTGIALSGITLLFTMYDGMVWTLEPLFYGRLGIPGLYGGLILASFVVPLILFEAPAGYLADRLGKRRVLTAGLIVAGAFTLLFAGAHDTWKLIAYAFLATTGLSLAWPAVEGMLADHTRKRTRGEVIGVWNAAKDSGYILGPVFGGLLAYQYSISTVFKVTGFVLLFSAGIALIAEKSVQSEAV